MEISIKNVDEITPFVILLLLFYLIALIKCIDTVLKLKNNKELKMKFLIPVSSATSIILLMLIAIVLRKLFAEFEDFILFGGNNKPALLLLTIMFNKMPNWNQLTTCIVGNIFLIVEFFLLFIKIEIKCLENVLMLRNFLFVLLVISCFSDKIYVYQAMAMIGFGIVCFDRSDLEFLKNQS